MIADRAANASPTVTGEPRPLMRGTLHLAAAMLAPKLSHDVAPTGLIDGRVAILILLDDVWGIPMLAAVWSLAAVGVLATIFWPDAPRWLRVGLYLGIGWIGVVPALQVVPAMSAGQLALLCLGGALYTVGAVVYARRSPNPFPRVFGFHEVFHTLVVAGSALHFALIALYVANA